jgi:hypothetical protein
MNKFKKMKKDREGNGKMALIAIVAVIAIVIGAFVIYPSVTGKEDESQMMFGVAITDVETGKTVSGEIAMASMSFAQQLLSLGQPRTVTLPAMYTAEEMAAFSANLPNIVLNKNYVVIPYIEAKAATTVPEYYVLTGTVGASFTGHSNTNYVFASTANSNTITSPNYPITLNSASAVTVNAPSQASSVRFSNVISSAGISHPFAGTFLTESTIHGTVTTAFKNTAGVPESKYVSADLLIHLVNPQTATFSITITNFGTGTL